MMLAAFREDLRRWGWRRSVLSRLMFRLQKHAGLYVCWVFERQMGNRPCVPPDGIALRELSEEDLACSADDPELDMSSDFVREALARGDCAIGAFESERLVSYAWFSFGVAPHAKDLNVHVLPPRHYGYKLFTRPSHRGRNIVAAIARYGDALFFERGCVAQIMFVEIANFASLKTQMSSGARRVGLAGYFKGIGMFLPFRTTAVKATGFKFDRARRIDGVR